MQGMLLFGPPGTGKTLIARQIGKMLNGKEPKVSKHLLCSLNGQRQGKSGFKPTAYIV